MVNYGWHISATPLYLPDKQGVSLQDCQRWPRIWLVHFWVVTIILLKSFEKTTCSDFNFNVSFVFQHVDWERVSGDRFRSGRDRSSPAAKGSGPNCPTSRLYLRSRKCDNQGRNELWSRCQPSRLIRVVRRPWASKTSGQPHRSSDHDYQWAADDREAVRHDTQWWLPVSGVEFIWIHFEQSCPVNFWMWVSTWFISFTAFSNCSLNDDIQ